MSTDPARLRNVALVGHSGAGKTTLTEALLAATGAIARAGRVEDGTTVCDSDEVEIAQRRSVSLAVASFEHDGALVTLIDTPGYADFVGELRAGLRAADAALFVVSATEPVDAATRMLWEECSEVAMPRAIVVTHLDLPRADFDETVADCQSAFGGGVMPLYLPVHDTPSEQRPGGGSVHLGLPGLRSAGSGPEGPEGPAPHSHDDADQDPVVGVIGLLSGQLADYSSGRRVERPADPEHLELIEEARAGLIEAIIAESEDESLMDRYLSGEQLDTKLLIDDLETAVSRGSFFPVLGFASPLGVGTTELLEVLVSGFPPPTEHPLPTVTRPDGSPVEPLRCDPQGPLCAEVVKTTTDPYGGGVSPVRVCSGTLRPDLPVHVSGHGHADRGHADHDLDEKVGHLFRPFGRQQRPLDVCEAGGICVVAKLAHAESGDTLSGRADPLLVEAWSMPEGLLPVAVAARARTDEDKLAAGLARLVAEDPTLRLDRGGQTGQLLVWCLGQAQCDVLLERLRVRFGVSVDLEPVRVALRETFTATSRGLGRHVKQSGGHGQYAVCQLEVSPLPSGSGLQFVDSIVGGAIPHQFVPSVEKGVRAQMARGVLAGYPLVDLRVELVDGKFHSVDSSDMAFQTAGALALKDAAGAGEVRLLEPVCSVGVLVAVELTGAVLADLSARRGRVTGTEPVGPEMTLVRAEVPELELRRYPVDLRSLTHGSASFTRDYLRHELMPVQMAAAVAAEAPAAHR